MHARFTSVLLTLLLFAPAAMGVQADAEKEREKPRASNRAGDLLKRVQALRDIEYAKAGDRSLKLDLYLPAEAGDADGQDGAGVEAKSGERRPLIVWIHGGGWRQGNKRRCPPMFLVPHGYVAASVEYRLSDVATWPAQIHDCKAAIRWLRAHAEKYGIDPDRIGVWGASAGGHLVAMLGASAGVPELEGDLGHNDQPSHVQAVCNWFGPSDLTRMAHLNARPNNPVALLLGGPVRERMDAARSASPLLHVRKDGPDRPRSPAFLHMHGDRDGLVPLDHSEKLHAALRAAGIASTLHVVEGAGHGFGGQKIYQTVADFFNETLRAK